MHKHASPIIVGSVLAAAAAVILAVILMIHLPLEGSNLTRENQSTNLANPASVYCTEQGYALHIKSSEAGQAGVCKLLDGTECDEWKFFRGECHPALNAVCGSVPACEGCGAISQQELEQGWYWGNCDQKKPNTPGDWTHSFEGTRSAKWVRATSTAVLTKFECDCTS